MSKKAWRGRGIDPMLGAVFCIPSSNTMFMRILFLIIFSFLTSLSAQHMLTGVLTDSSEQPLAGASVMLLQAEDSVLVRFGLTQEKGQFRIPGLKPGNYLLQASFLGYQSLYRPLSITTEAVDMGTLMMEAQTLTLETVTIEGEQVPIRMRNDTLEYNADAFGTRPTDAVEDLLRKLPGVEVERDGTIRARGERVQKVLVDGKEFFGDNPQMATKNLPADVVDKVQVFDKQSEMAEFTGIEDGQEQKAINLELKEDKKQGVFGSVEGGYGTQDRYNGRLNVNRFSNKLQLSVIGLANNINEQGFSFEEYLGFIGGLGNLMGGGSDVGSFRLELDPSSIGLPISQGLSSGFVNTGAGGVNTNLNLSKRTKLNLSYFGNHVRDLKDRTAIRQNVLGGETFQTEEAQFTENQVASHRLNVRLDHELDSFQSIIFRGSAGLQQGALTDQLMSQTLSPEGLLQNQGLRDQQSDRETISGNSSLLYRRRFRKKGRYVGLRGRVAYETRDQVLNLSANNQFIQDEVVDSLKQIQQQNEATQTWDFQANYTEPLGNKRYLGLSAGYRKEASEMVRDAFDEINGDQIENVSLTDQFDRSYEELRAGLSLRQVRDKLNLRARLDLMRGQLTGQLASSGLLEKQVQALLPSFMARYEIANGKSLVFNYSTELQVPTLRQLNPILDNRNPLLLYQGNNNLKAAYAHRVSLDWLFFDSFSFTSVFANVSATYTNNAITEARTIDSLFRQVVEPTNVDQDLRIQGFLDFSTPIRPLQIKTNLNVNGVYQRRLLFINSELNQLDRWVGTFRAELENRNQKVITAIIGGEWRQNVNRYSTNVELNQNFLTQSYYADVRVNLGENWQMGTQLDYDIYPADAFNEAQRIPIWQAEVTRYLFKHRRGILTLKAFDLLNRNVGFSRVSQANYIEEEQVLSLGRYFLLSFTWKLSAFKGEGGGSFQIRR